MHLSVLTEDTTNEGNNLVNLVFKKKIINILFKKDDDSAV